MLVVVDVSFFVSFLEGFFLSLLLTTKVTVAVVVVVAVATTTITTTAATTTSTAGNNNNNNSNSTNNNKQSLLLTLTATAKSKLWPGILTMNLLKIPGDGLVRWPPLSWPIIVMVMSHLFQQQLLLLFIKQLGVAVIFNGDPQPFSYNRTNNR